MPFFANQFHPLPQTCCIEGPGPIIGALILIGAACLIVVAAVVFYYASQPPDD